MEIQNAVLNRLRRSSPCSHLTMMISAYFYVNITNHFLLYRNQLLCWRYYLEIFYIYKLHPVRIFLRLAFSPHALHWSDVITPNHVGWLVLIRLPVKDAWDRSMWQLCLLQCALFPLLYNCSNTADFLKMMNFFWTQFSSLFCGLFFEPTLGVIVYTCSSICQNGNYFFILCDDCVFSIAF